jgi:hypothetical protein
LPATISSASFDLDWLVERDGGHCCGSAPAGAFGRQSTKALTLRAAARVHHSADGARQIPCAKAREVLTYGLRRRPSRRLITAFFAVSTGKPRGVWRRSWAPSRSQFMAQNHTFTQAEFADQPRRFRLVIKQSGHQ